MLPTGKKIVRALISPLLFSWSVFSVADVVLISDAKVTGVFSDFKDLFDPAQPYYGLFFQLVPGANATDLCPLGIHLYGNNLWQVTDPSDSEKDVNKAFTLLNTAWLADMTISVEGSADAPISPEERCTNAVISNIILHKS